MKIWDSLFGDKSNKIKSDSVVFWHSSPGSDSYQKIQHGMIIQTGENEKGRWTKFGDGTQICYCSKTVMPAPNTQVGNMWRSSSKIIEYPMKFGTLSTPAISIAVDSDTGFTWAGLGDKAAGNEGVGICIFAPVKSENTSKVSLIAIGRWK